MRHSVYWLLSATFAFSCIGKADEAETEKDARDCLAAYFDNLRALNAGYSVRGAGEMVDLAQNASGPVRIDWFAAHQIGERKQEIVYREAKWTYSREVDRQYDSRTWERLLTISEGGTEEIYHRFGLLSKPLNPILIQGRTDEERRRYARSIHSSTNYHAPNLVTLSMLCNVAIQLKRDDDDEVTRSMYLTKKFVRSEVEDGDVIGVWKIKRELKGLGARFRIKFDKQQGYMPTRVSAEYTGLGKNKASKPWYEIETKWKEMGKGSKRVYVPIEIESTVLAKSPAKKATSREFVARAVWAKLEKVDLADPEIREGGPERTKLSELNLALTQRLEKRLQAENSDSL